MGGSIAAMNAGILAQDAAPAAIIIPMIISFVILFIDFSTPKLFDDLFSFTSLKK
jgi:hypothetical protein